MTVSDWVLIVFGSAQVVAIGVHHWFGRRLSARIQQDLVELRRCNDEFAEAVELMRYGAHEEAVAIARGWRERIT